MGIFNIMGVIRDSLIKGGIINTTVPLEPKLLIKDSLVYDKNDMLERRQKLRKKSEDIAYRINPALGKVVRKKHNIEDTILNVADTIDNGIFRLGKYSGENDFDIGSHLFVQRIGYTHHGLYIGDNEVIHYLKKGVRRDSLEVFADGARIFVKNSPLKYDKDEVVRRARYRVWEEEYNVIFNNCESFVRWCRSGGEDLDIL